MDNGGDHDDDDGMTFVSGVEEEGEEDGWLMDTVRVPAEMNMDGRHAFQLTSDENDFIGATAAAAAEEEVTVSSAELNNASASATTTTGEAHSASGVFASASTKMSSGAAAADDQSGAAFMSPITAAAAAAATEAEVEAAVLRGLADAKTQMRRSSGGC